jgi:hypothetical protein
MSRRRDRGHGEGHDVDDEQMGWVTHVRDDFGRTPEEFGPTGFELEVTALFGHDRCPMCGGNDPSLGSVMVAFIEQERPAWIICMACLPAWAASEAQRRHARP